eukprot:TRINITY_DN26294_c0_g1_i1.p1 TRINITY_DN26294_c0_g1~~TRINITY_DN26294_c0_g1_i1.p1  ORF type:complete len:952 (+),score=305.50 TRINITY_DN26294_c0_g1_i1:140-2995(+)
MWTCRCPVIGISPRGARRARRSAGGFTQAIEGLFRAQPAAAAAPLALQRRFLSQHGSHTGSAADDGRSGEELDTAPEEGHIHRFTKPMFRMRGHTFIDKMTFVAKGGDGAAGGIFWVQYANTPDGGPGGGDGGTGGSVFAQCSPKVHELSHLLNHGYVTFDPENFENATVGLCTAGHGLEGDAFFQKGNWGLNVLMPLPKGTVIIDADNNRELVEFTRPGEKFELAAGGKGGVGNARLRSSVVRAPNYSELGHRGESRTYTIELRVFADVAFVGRTNSGKSSLLGAISRAAPEPAPWAFTTWRPNIGHVYPDEDSKFSVADLPALAPNAHLGTGEMGNDFLRHLYRVNSIVYVIDVASHTTKKKDVANPLRPVPLEEVLDSLQQELDYFEEGFSHKAVAIAVTKMDMLIDPITREETWKKMEAFQKKTNLPVFPVSAHTKQGVLDLMLYMSKMVKRWQNEKEVAETERTRKIRRESRLLDEVRLAETKQIIVQRMQDFHMQRAVETLLEDRIRGRPNSNEIDRGNVDLTRSRVISGDGIAPEETASQKMGGEVLSLKDVETDDMEPFVHMGDMEDAVHAGHPEDWGVGDMTDLVEDRRTQHLEQSDIWSNLALRQDAIEIGEESEARLNRELTERTTGANVELRRGDYTKSLIGAGSPEALANLDLEELEKRYKTREEGLLESIKTGTPFIDAKNQEAPKLTQDHYAALPESGTTEASEPEMISTPINVIDTDTTDGEGTLSQKPEASKGDAESAAAAADDAEEERLRRLYISKFDPVGGFDIVQQENPAIAAAFERSVLSRFSEWKATEAKKPRTDVNADEPYELYGGEGPEYERIQKMKEEREERFMTSYKQDHEIEPAVRPEKLHPDELIFEPETKLSKVQQATLDAKETSPVKKARKKLLTMTQFADTTSHGDKAYGSISQEKLAEVARMKESILSTGKYPPGMGPK